MATEIAPWSTPGPITTAEKRVDAEAYAIGAVYRTLIEVGQTMSPRSLQNAIGSSELGYACDRRIAYRLAGTLRTNYRDPLASMLGTGWHAVMQETFNRLNTIMGGRFLTEVPVVYRNVPGTCDLYDRTLLLVADWKTSTLDKISHMRSQDPASNYVTQVQTYAAGMEAAGYEVRHVALVFIPRDGKGLDQMWVWRGRYDRAVADAAIDRIESLRGKDPASVAASPDRLCGWCPNYREGTPDLAVGCPGMTS